MISSMPLLVLSTNVFQRSELRRTHSSRGRSPPLRAHRLILIMIIIIIAVVMAAQRDLVEIVHTLHQVVCVKG